MARYGGRDYHTVLVINNAVVVVVGGWWLSGMHAFSHVMLLARLIASLLKIPMSVFNCHVKSVIIM